LWIVQHSITQNFPLPFGLEAAILVHVKVELFIEEMTAAVKAFNKYIICLNKTPEEFERSLVSLMTKAIAAFEGRGAGLRHGIALDKHMTVILSQNGGARPLCGIYFNLHSPYQEALPAKTAEPVAQATGAGEAN
jgi:hypothetical protein